RLTMNEADTLHAIDKRREQVQQIVVIGMAGEAVQVNHVGPFVPGSAVQAYLRTSFEQLPAWCTWRLIAYQNDGTARDVNMFLQMMHDPPTLAHASRSDNDIGLATPAKLTAFGSFT